jgi:Fur family transcriptional regulator, ferric uptake regulator
MAPALTARQSALLEFLRSCDGELSGQALHGRLREAGVTIGLATVYRHLRTLQQQGLIRCRHLPNGEALYAPLERDVHHLTCLECGRSSELPLCPVGSVSVGEHLPAGFQPLFHTLEIYGLCAGCAAPAAALPTREPTPDHDGAE